MAEFLLAAAGLIVATVAVGLVRILAGPADVDRTMAAQLLGTGGVATLGVTSPLKVESAKVRYTAPVAYDLATESLVSKSRTMDLAPDSREMNLELGWSGAFGKSSLGFGAAYGFNAGNQQGQQSAAGWMRFATQF